MISDEVRSAIRIEVRRQINVLLPGTSQNSSQDSEDILNMYSGIANALPARPIVRPYGLSTCAVDGTTQVVGRLGDSEGNRVVLGHRDAKAPFPENQGESIVYSVGGYQMRVQNDAIEIGKDGEFEPQVLGDTLTQFLISLVGLIVEHNHSEDGASPPNNAAEFTSLQEANLDNNLILCEDGGGF